MANLKQLKEKRNIVNSIYKITSAMEIISTTKSRQAVRQLGNFQNFYNDLYTTIKHLSYLAHEGKKEDLNGTLWVIFTSDLGLAGGYNTFVIKQLLEKFNDKDSLLIIGQKGRSSLNAKITLPKDTIFYTNEQMKDLDIVGEISQILLKHYLEDKKAVKCIYTLYKSQLEFVPTVFDVFPLEEIEPNETHDIFEIKDPMLILNNVLDLFIYSTLIYCWRESIAAEHTSRRIAMENASNNGEEILKQITIEYNRTRQAKITQEILEIIGGSEGLK